MEKYKTKRQNHQEKRAMFSALMEWHKKHANSLAKITEGVMFSFITGEQGCALQIITNSAA